MLLENPETGVIKLDEFRGLFVNNDEDTVPPNHFKDSLNNEFGPGFFRTRYGTSVSLTFDDARRTRVYSIPGEADRLLILNGDGELYDSTHLASPILTIATMTDFSAVSIFGRAYISPHDGEIGLEDEVVYVYDGADGTFVARAAAGLPPVGFDLTLALAIPSANGADIVAPVAPVNGAQTLTTSPFIPGVPCTIKITQTGGTVTAITVTVVGFGMSHVAQTEAYINPVLSAGPSTFVTGEIWEEITSITISGLAGAGGSFKVEVNATPGGKVEIGFHVVGIVYETVSGFLTKPGPENNLSAINVNKKNRAISVSGIPASPGTEITKIHVVMSKFIKKKQYSGNADPQAYEMFFVPESSGGLLDPGRTSTIINAFDADLLDSADYLLDNLSQIPAGVKLFATSKGRLLIGGEFEDQAIIRGSKGGEPESVSATDGFVICDPVSGNVKNFSEYRDSIYAYKSHATVITQDNGDTLSTWLINIIDRAIGSESHAIGTVLGKEGDVSDAIIVGDRSGLHAFNGAYPERPLSWKIKELWDRISDEAFFRTEIAIDPVGKQILITAQSEDAEAEPGTQRVVNPDAENGTTIGWTTSGDSPPESVVNPGGGGGSRVFAFNTTEESESAMQQDITIVDNESATISVALRGNGTIASEAYAYLPTLDLWLHSDLTWGTEEAWATRTAATFATISLAITVPTGETIVRLIAKQLFTDAGIGYMDDYTWTVSGTEPGPDFLLMADYSEGLDWQNIKWDIWEFYADAGEEFAPDSIVTHFDDTVGKAVFKIAWRDSASIFYYYKGSGTLSDNEETIFAYYETYKYSASNSGAVSHLSGMRIKVNGFGELILTLIGPDGSPLEVQSNLIIPESSKGNILQKFNFVEDDISIFAEVEDFEHNYQISSIWLFGSEIWAEKPSGLEFDLLLNLVSYWNLDETSGTRFDSHGANNLSDVNGVGQASGPGGVGNAALFVKASNQYLQASDAASLDFGDEDFTFAAWVYLDSYPSGNNIMNIVDKANNYSLTYHGSPDTFFGFYVTGLTRSVSSTNLGMPELATWYFIIFWYDASTDTLYIQVDDYLFNSQVQASTPEANTRPFYIGHRDLTSTRDWDGRIAKVGLWNRILTAHEREFLYNSGIGRSYSQLNP